MHTARSPVTAPRSRALLCFLVIAVAALWVAIPGMDLRSIENHDRPRFARIAQNILWQDEWIVMRYAGEPYTSKPPLLMWLIALFSLPFGHVNMWTARLPSALASLAGGLATYGIGARLADRRVGFLAAVVLLTSWKWTWYAHSITTDMLLSGCIAVTVYCAVRAFAAERAGPWWFLAGVMAGLASLAKGPIGLLGPAAVIGGTWAVTRPDRPRITRQSLWLLVGFVPTFLPWVILLAREIGWSTLWETLDQEVFHRITSPTGQAKPVWYYPQKLPTDIMPWSFLWLGLVALVRPGRVRAEWQGAAWLGWVWALLPIVLFTLSRGKAQRFILCVYPGWALLTSLLVWQAVDRWEDRRRWDQWLVRWPVTGLAVSALVAPAVALAGLPHVPFPDVVRVAAVSGLLLAGMAAYLLVVHRGAANLLVAVGIVAAASLMGHAWHLRLLAEQDDPESPYRMAALDTMAAAGGRPVVTHGLIDHRVNYHFREGPLDSADAVQERFRSGEPVACVFWPEAWDGIRDAVAPWVGEARELEWVGKRVVLALSKAAPPNPAAILPSDAAHSPAAPSLRSLLRSNADS